MPRNTAFYLFIYFCSFFSLLSQPLTLCCPAAIFVLPTPLSTDHTSDKHNLTHPFPPSPPFLPPPCPVLQLDVRWEMVACGKTENQRRLTEQARQFVTQDATALKPRSLNL